MSEENVEILRSIFDSFARGDTDAPLARIDPDFGWDISTHPLPDIPNHGQGRQSFASEFIPTYLGGFNDYEFEVTELIDAGQDVVVVLHETARMPGADATLDRDLVQIWTVEESRAVFLRVFKTKQEALKAMGLSD